MPKTGPASVRFHFLEKKFSLSHRTHLKQFIVQLIKEQGFVVQVINYIFCSDEYLLEINRQYLNHDTYTDIITFQLSERTRPIVSDIFISIPRVRDNARGFGQPFSTELHRVMFHGALHLCGYRDKTGKEKQNMRQLEDLYLRKYGFT